MPLAATLDELPNWVSPSRPSPAVGVVFGVPKLNVIVLRVGAGEGDRVTSVGTGSASDPSRLKVIGCVPRTARSPARAAGLAGVDADVELPGVGAGLEKNSVRSWLTPSESKTLTVVVVFDVA